MRGTADALVLRVCDMGEHDRLLLVLTANEGKKWICAKGARSVRSKYASLCRAFAYINLEFYEKNDRLWLSGGSLINGFFDICSDLDGFSLASYIMQLTEEITGENTPAHDILKMALNTLYAIENRLYPNEQIKAVYELFSAKTSGFEPNLSYCTRCKRLDFDSAATIWLDVMNGAVICQRCLSEKSGNLPLPETDRFATRNLLLPLNSSALCAMRYVLSADPRRIFAFSLSDSHSMSFFSRAAEAYILNHLERDFSTLIFYNSMNNKNSKEQK